MHKDGHTYSVRRDEIAGVYHVTRDGQPFRTVCQTILEIRLGIVLSDAEVIEIAEQPIKEG